MKKQLLKLSTGIGLLFLSCLLVLNSCKKETTDIKNPTGGGNGWTNTEMTKASFTGQIVQEDGTPLTGAKVSTGTHQITTDGDGFFYFSNISTLKNATLIRVEKIGYFKAFRTISVLPNQDNQTRIMVMELPVPEILNATTGGTIKIANGGTINFAANSIVDATTNLPYTGVVSVFAKWIDPSSSNLPLLIPGALRGINNSNAEQGLATYGMQAVELVGSNGQALQLNQSTPASVTFPVPSSMAVGAPATIPLWHFDENKGMWIEDGEAIKQGGNYVGDVSHFSFWNCDYPFPYVNFTITLVDQNNNPINGAIVKLTQTNATTASAVGYGWTNSAGTTTGAIPQNGTFDISYIPAGCTYGSPYTFIQTMTSTTSNITLGPITVTNSASPAIITGTVQDCNNTILANAPVKVKVGTNLFTATTNASGAFTVSINCLGGTTSAIVTAFDATNAINGSSTINISPNATTNAGVVQACGTQNDFITFDVTNPPATTPTSYSIVEPAGTFTQYYFTNTLSTSIYGTDQTTNPALPVFINFEFDGPQTVAGVHNLVRYYDSNDSSATNTAAIVNLSNYGAIGGKISGSFTTTVTGFQFYNNAVVNCNFSVTRQQ